MTEIRKNVSYSSLIQKATFRRTKLLAPLRTRVTSPF